MEYTIVKTFTTERVYTIVADSEEEALEYIEDNPNLYDEEECDEKTMVNGEVWYDC